MANILTDWRVAIMEQLRENLQDGTFGGDAVVAGEIDNGPQDRNLACVFAPPLVTDTADIDFARPVMVVRAWLTTAKTLIKTVPTDPAPTEQLMIDLAVCLQGIQTLALSGKTLTSTVVKIVPDYPDFGVEATLRGFIINPATLA